MNNPDYLRRVPYNPHDGRVVLGNTLFEQESCIWNSKVPGISLEKNGGSKDFGPGALKFEGAAGQSIRLESRRTFDARSFEDLEFTFVLSPPPTPKVKKRERKRKPQKKTAQSQVKGHLSLEYHNGKKWIPMFSA